MAGEQRKCANCRYFQDAGVAKNGWCTHPKRQTTSDVKLLMRAGELACRNPWGGDLFESRRVDQQAQDAASPDAPAADDEVTSVVTPPERVTAPHRNDEDRVVSDRPAPLRDPDDDDTHNDAARFDQDERARVMARGSRDAIMRARERHSNRRNPAGAVDADADIPATHDRVVSHQSRFSDRDAPAASGRRIDDAPVPRSEIRNRFAIPADRFDSVPDIDPSFDLPGYMSGTDQTDDSAPARVEPADTPDADRDPEEQAEREESGEPYEHVLGRARRIREAKMQKAANPLRHSHLLARHQSRSRSELETAPPPIDADGDTELVSDAPEGVDEPIFDAPVATEASRPDASIDHASADSDRAADEPANEWEASIDDAPAEQTGHRAGIWLSRFGIRRRAAMLHDDAQVTRHSAGWDDENLDEIEPERRYRPARKLDGARVDTGIDHQNDRHPEAVVTRYAGRQADEPDLDVPDGAANVHASEREPGHGVVDNNIPPPPARPAPTLPDLHDAYGDPIAPVPAPARSRTEQWHRQRTTQVSLPDLDDNLFEETFERPRPASPADALDRAPIPDPEPVPRVEVTADPSERSAGWSRESYFRASRYRSGEAEPGTRHDDAPARSSHDTPTRLPDLDAGGFDLRELVTRGGELLDMTIDIAPEVPRECRTCRSFRSADGGARGWCTNEWAFTHRRMVNEDNLACETTIGCWWLPADRYWLIEETEGFAAPTPRIDRLIAQRDQPAEKKISGA